MIKEIRKKLSANDVGLTGSHQAGILVPKEGKILGFFPTLPQGTKNPRATLAMRERVALGRWDFNFIYYNNRLFGGTRNEFRLTCMTGYLRAVDAKPGDDLVFSKDDDASFMIDIVRAHAQDGWAECDGVLLLSGGWKIISIHK